MPPDRQPARVTRACDQCAKYRARCDGQVSCERCTENALECTYDRPLMRRGPKVKNARARATRRSFPYGTHVLPGFSHLANLVTPLSPPLPPPPPPPPPVNHEPKSPRVSGELQRPSTSGLGNIPVMNPSHPSPSVNSTTGQSPPSARRCRYPSLIPLLPRFKGIVDGETACKLLDHYFARPSLSLFDSASPYVLDPILRKASLQRGYMPRALSPSLCAALLWMSAQTAPLTELMPARRRRQVSAKLKALVTAEIARGTSLESKGIDTTTLDSDRCAFPLLSSEPIITSTLTAGSEPDRIDELLACILVAVVISASDYKSEVLSWYNSAVRLAKLTHLHRIDAPDVQARQAQNQDLGPEMAVFQEQQEEKRRAFWLLYSLDRHWSLCYNSTPQIQDQDCQVYVAIHDDSWLSPHEFCTSPSSSQYGPPFAITGTGFFEYFLPLMRALGDVIWIHHMQTHPRLFHCVTSGSLTIVEDTLTGLKNQIEELISAEATDRPFDPDMGWTFDQSPSFSDSSQAANRTMAVWLYAKFIIHTLAVLLHGRWDALDLLSRDAQLHTYDPPDDSNPCGPVRLPLSDWITSEHFIKCSSNAIAASEILSNILRVDPELALVPYLLGIYLLHESFLILLFADRMPEVSGSTNQSVERACETVIRAYEASIATLNVEYQRDIRKIMRRKLYNVRHARDRGLITPGSSDMQSYLGDDRQRRESINQQNGRAWLGESNEGLELSRIAASANLSTDVLTLYRWAPGFYGLAV